MPKTIATEPIMAEGGLVVPPPGYFERVKDGLDEMGALFHRGRGAERLRAQRQEFAIEHRDVEPDVICMAKRIVNGWPLGAFISRSEARSAERA